MENLLRDVRHAWRSLRKRASFTVMVVSILALGMSATTCIFAVVNALVLQPLNYEDPDRLLHIDSSIPKRGVPQFAISTAEYLDYREQSQVFEDIAAYGGETETFNLKREDEPVRLPGRRVSSNLFNVLGVKAALGRTFSPAEEGPGTPKVVILSDVFWTREFGRDQQVINRSLLLDEVPYAIIGVLPRGVMFPTSEVQVWLPFEFELATQARRIRRFAAVGRLSEGATLDQARVEMAAIAKRLEQQYPETNTDFEARVITLQEQLLGENVALTWLVALVSVVSLLVISCANVASLLLIQGTVRFREFAIRATLGAGRLQTLRLFLAEAAILAGLGSAVALALSYFGGVTLVAALVPTSLPTSAKVTLDPRALVFAGLLALATALACGSLPALLLTIRSKLALTMREGGRTGSGGAVNATRTVLVVLQVALAFSLLVAAGVLIKSFWNLQRIDRGIRAENVLAVRLTVPQRKYPDEPRIIDHLQRILERVRQLPGVQSAAAINELPATGYINWGAQFTPEDRPGPPAGQEPIGHLRIAGPDYFRTMGIPLLKGREFTRHDRLGEPDVIVVNSLLERLHFPEQGAIGKFLKIRGRPAPAEIVGVVSDVRQAGPREPIRPAIYFSYTQRPVPTTSLVLRTGSSPSGLAAAVRGTVALIDSSQALFKIETVEQAFAEDVSRDRALAGVLSVLVFAAVLLAAAGLYGVVAYTMAQRTREIGIRGALGARRKDIAKLVVRQGLGLTLVGLLVGFGCTLLANPLLSPLLFEVESLDPAVTALVILLLGGVSLLAMFFPSRRAAAIDPVVALRLE